MTFLLDCLLVDFYHTAELIFNLRLYQSKHTWYQDLPMHHQITSLSDNALCILYGNFRILMKRQKKWVNLANFWKFIYQKHLVQFSWNLECGVLILEGISTAEITQFCWSSTKLHISENYITVIYSQCGMPASWIAWHTTVCLNYEPQ